MHGHRFVAKSGFGGQGSGSESVGLRYQSVSDFTLGQQFPNTLNGYKWKFILHVFMTLFTGLHI